MRYKQYRHLREQASRRGIRRAPAVKMRQRQHKYLYAKMLRERTIRKAWANLRKGKTKREAVRKIDGDLDEEVKKMRLKILNTKPDGYGVENPELAYEPPRKRDTKIVNERGKRRVAYLADIREQWYFHIIVEVLKPIVMGRLYRFSCGGVPGRGPHSGKRHIESAVRKGKGIRNFLKADIRHFYDSLKISTVIRELRKVIADELFLYCIAKIYRYVKKGIMIGLFISPWLANYVLISLDAAILSFAGVVYTRYMDDLTVFAEAKKTLRAVLVAAMAELGRLRLRLKRTYQICKFDYETKRTKRTRSGKVIPVVIGRPLDFMGFVFFRNRTVIRKRIMLSATRAARKLKRAKEAGRRYCQKALRAMVSLMGWFKHTDSHGCYLAEIKPFVNIGKARKIISKIDKEVSRNDRMEKGALLRKAA